MPKFNVLKSYFLCKGGRANEAFSLPCSPKLCHLGYLPTKRMLAYNCGSQVRLALFPGGHCDRARMCV